MLHIYVAGQIQSITVYLSCLHFFSLHIFFFLLLLIILLRSMYSTSYFLVGLLGRVYLWRTIKYLLRFRANNVYLRVYIPQSNTSNIVLHYNSDVSPLYMYRRILYSWIEYMRDASCPGNQFCQSPLLPPAMYVDRILLWTASVAPACLALCDWIFVFCLLSYYFTWKLHLDLFIYSLLTSTWKSKLNWLTGLIVVEVLPYSTFLIGWCQHVLMWNGVRQKEMMNQFYVDRVKCPFPVPAQTWFHESSTRKSFFFLSLLFLILDDMKGHFKSVRRRPRRDGRQSG